MKKITTFSNSVTKIKSWLVALIAILFASVNSYAQTNPTAQAPTITENFGTTTFSTLAAHFATWTVNSSPIGSQGNAESSTASGNSTIFAASGTQTTGGSYGYATSSNGRFYIQTSSNGTNGTNQLAGAINATGLGSIVIAYSIEMISANPRTIGVELQYRIGTTGSWTNVSGTVYSHASTDRSNGNTDSYNVTLPSAADNNAVVQIRWATWRGSQTGNSSGIAIDNISITASTFQSTYYFRSKQNGNWNSATTWEVSPDNSTWSNAATIPNYRANTITVSGADSVSITATDTLDQVVVNGILSYEDVGGSTPALYNGTGTELTINGKFYDAGPNSITWLSVATWSLGSNGYLIRNRGTSSNNWRDNYAGSISTIPATAHWIARKNGTDSPTLSSTGMYYPNLKIENYTGSAWTTGTSSSFTGSASSPVIKGDLLIGGSGSNTVSFLNSNTATAHVYVLGDLTLKSGSTLRNHGTGFQVEGDLNLNGTVDYGGTGAGFILSGNGNQNLSGNLTFASFELNKSSTSATITLQSPATITGALSFVKGYLITSSTNLLTFAHHASVGNAGGNNTNDSSFVKGPVRKIGNSLFTFPLGKGSNYQYIRISAPTDTTDAYTAEYFNTGQTLGTATDPTYDYISTCEYFTLDRTTGTSNVSVTLAYDMFSCVANLFPDPRIIGWDGSKWADLGTGTITASPFGGSIASDGSLSQYGEITLGNNSNSTIFPPDTAIIPTSFRYIKNSGQLIATNDSLRPDIKYYMNDAYPQAYFSDTALSYVFAHIDTIAASTDTMVRVDVQYLGANSTYPVAQKADSTYTNYFLAHCPNGVTGVTQHQRLNYGSLYNHIDLIYRQNRSGLKYAFNVYPGGKPSTIKAKYTGADSVKILVTGQLRIYTKLGNLTYNAPNAFKVDSSGLQSAVACNWNVANGNEVTFTFPGGHNFHLPLAIMVEQDYAADPMHINNPEWSQYFGGNGYDEGTGVTTDTDGNPYFTGFTSSVNFPTSTGVQPVTGGGFDAYIAKFGSANGASMGMVMHADERLWTTYYGGTGDDRAYAISTSGGGIGGSVFVTGYTENGGFPTFANGIYNQSANTGGKDAFIIKLDNQNGGGINPTATVWATHFGGNGDEIAKSIKNDGAGNFYIGGSTSSATYSSDNCIVPTDNNFPSCNTFSAFDNGGAYGGGTTDAFIAKFSNAGTLLWSSFYGGSAEDVINGIAIDGSNTVYLTGKTASSSGFPLQTVSGSDVYNQGTFGTGTYDAFVSKFNSSGTHLWSSYFGGSGDEQGVGIAVDANDNLYISGETSSSTPACTTCVCLVPTTGQFPLCHPAGAYFQGTGNTGTYGGGSSDGFIAKFDSDCYLKWGTYYGGNGQDVINSLALDYQDQLFFVGTTLTSSPTTNIQSVGSSGGWYYNQSALSGPKDCFLGNFDASNARYWSSYFGASTIDVGNSIAVYSTSSVNEFWYITGATNSLVAQMAFNAVGNCCPNAYTQTNFNLPTSTEAYVARFSITGMYMMGVENIDNNQSIDALVYPNPASHNITLKLTLTERENVSIEVFSITGQLLYTAKMGKQQGEITKEIDFSKFSNAVYILQIKTDTKMISKKIIKHE